MQIRVVRVMDIISAQNANTIHQRGNWSKQEAYSQAIITALSMLSIYAQGYANISSHSIYGMEEAR